MVSPCCGRLFHLQCVQAMATACGRAHFKCPLCSDKKAFVNEAVNFGVYLPEKDAEWEKPELEGFYNFQGMGKSLGDKVSACDEKCRIR